jgi:hypothetical protein
MPAVRAATLIAILLLLGASTAGAQGVRGGHIAGRTVDSMGAVLPGVTVTATAGNVRRQAVSDANGGFDIGDLPPAFYTVTAQIPGFNVAVREVTITAPTATVAISLVLNVGDLCSADYVYLGFADAVAHSDLIVHARIVSLEPTPGIRAGCIVGALTYTAAVIETIKGRPDDPRPSTIRWIEDAPGTGQLGQEYVVFLGWDSAHSRYTGTYVFAVRDGHVTWDRDDVPEMTDGAPLDRLIDVIRAASTLGNGR